jgi:hypothetical protein
MGYSISSTDLATTKIATTDDGGLAVKLVNKTGADSIKGYCVTAGSADNSVILVPVDSVNCLGVFLESDIPDGSEAWVVVSGIADVYFFTETTRGHMARTGLTADTGEVSGQAISEAFPAVLDDTLCKVGNVLESKAAAGLAKVLLHFN